MKPFVVLSLLLMCYLSNCCMSYLLRENVLFFKTNRVSLTHDSWRIALTLDLEPYDIFIRKVSEDSKEIEQLIRTTVQRYQGNKDNPNFVVTFKGLEQEVSRLTHTYQTLRAKFHNNKFIRQKRSLLPFLGKIIGWVAGMSTDDELNSVRRNVINLEKTQKAILHVVDENLTVLNVTRRSTIENRETINQILTSLEQMSTDFSKYKDRVHLEVVKITEFVQTYLRVSHIVQNFREIIERGFILYEHLSSQLNAVALSHLSPVLIEPSELSIILHEIKQQLPPMLKLPFTEEKDFWLYYRNLPCSGALIDNQIVIVLYIPVAEMYEQFDIYHMASLPLPINITEQKIESTMVADYKLHGVGLAINEQRTRFAILNKDELSSCSVQGLPYCRFSSALYSVATTKKCPIHLFLHSKDKIKKYCHKTVVPNVALPTG
ncbi:uncharacterized protein LOC132733092 [Ruditapes philippinarum]|uniref:uncharacterized protein LOC132733092 n=1 Tax=Ruditapes philippinarum TaxID=129788 RepID=UPI00295B3921|nr:uncharacterized protein LOC132733092 [Ruditapes philippinarum]